MFPHSSAGFAVSARLVSRLADELKDGPEKTVKFPHDICIDPEFSLAWVVAKSLGVVMTHSRRFCHDFARGSKCAVYPRSATCVSPTKDKLIGLASRTLFAVKTAKHLHEERLPVLRETWVAAAPNVAFFSEGEDPRFGTVVLPGVVNTKRGHCAKTVRIIDYFADEASKDLEWLVITDDDTILGVRKVLEELWCYVGGESNRESDGGLYLGERFGVRVTDRHGGGRSKDSYDYITGGGGIVLDRRMVDRITGCACPADDFFDDLHVGSCVAAAGGVATHSRRFHHGRPRDYHPALLEADLGRGGPVSFHKFVEVDPRQIYSYYFREGDEVLRNYKDSLKEVAHAEL